jgi:DNA-binding transcriptional LysR family regulator
LQDLNDLRYFVRVVEHGGFAAASRALDVPRSKLSRRIAVLEEQLEVRLIQRSTRSFAVTEVGFRYFQRCLAMLAEAEKAKEVIALSRSEPNGTLRLACPPPLLRSHVAGTLQRFLVRHPRVRVAVEATNRPIDLIAEGFDLAVRFAVGPLTDDDIIAKKLATSDLILAAAPSLFNGGSLPETPDDLAGLPALDIKMRGDTAVWPLVSSAGHAYSFSHHPRFVCDDVETLREAAVAGLGLIVMAYSVIEADLAAGRLVQVLPGWSLPNGVIFALYPSRKGLVPAVRTLIDDLEADLQGQRL